MLGRIVIWNYFFLISCFLVFLYSCKKNNQNSTPQLHKDYFDVTQGRYIEYKVVEINHDKNALVQHDTLRYFLKIQIEDTLLDNIGRICNKYVRYKKTNLTDPWILSDVWTTIIDGNNAEIVEENQRTIKLKFPVNIYTTWDANIFNNLSSLDCFYEEIHKPRTINGLSFDSTVRVNQGSDRNLIRYFKRFETYAKGIGMIEKYYKDLNISNFDTLNISSGKELYFKPIQFGIN
jgi:hypothetical protein